MTQIFPDRLLRDSPKRLVPTHFSDYIGRLSVLPTFYNDSTPIHLIFHIIFSRNMSFSVGLMFSLEPMYCTITEECGISEGLNLKRCMGLFLMQYHSNI